MVFATEARIVCMSIVFAFIPFAVTLQGIISNSELYYYAIVSREV